MTSVWSVDPRTGHRLTPVASETTSAEIEEHVESGMKAFAALQVLDRAGRARILRALARELLADSEGLASVGDRETALGMTRLKSELGRTIYQLRLFADAVEAGDYLEVTIDNAQDEGLMPRPDLRRMLIPLHGPVAVFGASNFPFAFSVAGGDTAAAIAAGCPVIVKCHSGHPETSVRTLAAWHRAADEEKVPREILQMIYGRDAGTQLVLHPRIRAVSFTGSAEVGRTLHDLAATRPDPIPFFGELAGLNPFVVTPGAAEERGAAIGEGLAESTTLGAGQFCTKAGVAFVPAGSAGDHIVERLRDVMLRRGSFTLLTPATRTNYVDRVEALSGVPTTANLLDGRVKHADDGLSVNPAIVSTSIRDLKSAPVVELFGPGITVVRYEDVDELLEVLRGLDGALTGTIHSSGSETELTTRIASSLTHVAGRLIFNGYPTGVAVTDAMTHGGPWPSTTNASHSSVGPSAIRRFLRPITWQNAPSHVLPPEVRNDSRSVPRRVDGRTVAPSQQRASPPAAGPV